MKHAWCKAILSGVLLALSQPLVIPFLSEAPIDPTGLSGLLALVAYVPLLLSITESTSVARVFKLSFLTSVTQFAITFYWLTIAMSVFGSMPLWLSLVVLLLLSGVLALYLASAFALAQYLRQSFGFRFWLVLPASVCAFEYLRNYGWFGGFPWGNVGYSLASVPVLLQSASLVGVYGLVFIVVMCNAIVGGYAKLKFQLKLLPKTPLLVLLLVLLAMSLWGTWRLEQAPSTDGSLKMALLQANIEQGIKNQSTLYASQILSRFAMLSQQVLQDEPDLIVWPEASYPYHLSQKTQKLILPTQNLPPTLVGVLVYDEKMQFRNSALSVSPKGELVGRYDKTHLVPFGEYVPWPFGLIVKKLVPNLGQIVPSQAFLPLRVALQDGRNIDIGVTICYEGVFPEISRTLVQNGASVLVNLTNDAWYGVSSAPYQHLNMYSMRAVETGRAFARATNTGVSAFIDPRGRISSPSSLYVTTTLTQKVPLGHEQTLYVRVGDVVPMLCLLFVLLSFVTAFVGRDVLLRRRSWIEWGLGALGLALMVFSQAYFAADKALLVESALTKDTVLKIFGLVMFAGAWSGRAKGRKAILWASGFVAVTGLLIGFGDAIYWGTAAFGAAVFLLSYFRVKAYSL